MATMYVADVNLAADHGDLLKGEARVVVDGRGVQGARVAFALELPDGAVVALGDDTNLSGVAQVEHKAAGQLAPGTYVLRVTGVAQARHTYDPARNVESQATLVV